MHRIGSNFEEIPVNCPFRSRVTNYERDGAMMVDGDEGGLPNFDPNS